MRRRRGPGALARVPRPTHLRARLTAGVVTVLAVTLLAGGAVLARDADRAERASLDDRLVRTAELVDAAALAAIEEEVGAGDARLDRVLAATDSSLVVSFAGETVLGSGRVAQQPGDAPLGLSTSVGPDGQPVRRFAKALRPGDDVERLEVASSLRQVQRRAAALRRRLVLVGLPILLVAGLGTWLAADRVLRPVRRVRRAAEGIAGDADLARRVPEGGAVEVADLARTFNAMLERLRRSAEDRGAALEATRRFAADVGHELRTPLTSVGAALSTVHRHPDADPATLRRVAGDALAEQRRVVALLDGMQALVRGDVAPAEHDELDLRDPVAEAVRAVGERHPEATIGLRLPDAPVRVRGWEPGLRLVAENLVANAVVHGRPGGHVDVVVADDGGPPGGVELVVDDDGPGVPAADRDRVFAPFERGRADGPGSGLGLAIVRQQADRHGATVTLGVAPAGGARVTVRLPSPTEGIPERIS